MALPNNRSIFDMAKNTWREQPPTIEWQFAWREDVSVPPDMQAWVAACQQYIASRIDAEMAEALTRMTVAWGWDVAQPGGDEPAQTYAEVLAQEIRASVVADLFYRSDELLRSLPSPTASPASPLSGSGYYGHGEREIPDTPLDEWCAGVEALLAECAVWEQQVDEVLKE